MSGSSPPARGVVEGEVQFPPDAPPFAGATVHVKLLDVTFVDGAARTVGEQVIRDVAHPGPLAFSVAGEALDPGARYVVRVHVDVDGDGRVSRGDYVSTESYPVLTRGYPDRVVVRVRPVGA